MCAGFRSNSNQKPKAAATLPRLREKLKTKTWPKDHEAEDLLKEAEERLEPKPAAMPKLAGEG